MAEGDDEDEWSMDLSELGVEIRCPQCGNDVIRDGNSLELGASRTGGMFECGNCHLISQWRWTLDPFVLTRVLPIEWGGRS